MTVDCSECEKDVKNPGIGIIRALQTREGLHEGRGIVACRHHYDDISSKVHQSPPADLGVVYIIDERIDNEWQGKKMQLSGSCTRVHILGYLTPQETALYFPQTFKRLEPASLYI